MTLFKELHGGDPDGICLGISAASSKEKAKSVQLFGLHPSAVHVCSMFMYVHIVLYVHWGELCGGLMYMFRIVINKLFRIVIIKLFK
jgi:hypothetical protein